MSRFLVAGQWQGSGAARAMRLVDGAEAIARELPSSATTVIEIPLEAGDAEDTGILRYSAIRLVRERLQLALATHDDTPIVIGGDCGVEYASIEHAARRGRVIVLWADAHADLNTATSSPSGAFHGMVLRSLIDAGIVAAADVLLLGVRDLDDAEAAFIDEAGITRVSAESVAEALTQRAAAARASDDEAALYVHIDLDVLDPSVFASVGFAAPFGLSLDEVTSAIDSARGVLPLCGAGLMEYAPARSPDADASGDSADENGGAETAADELSVILRILAALTR